MIESFHVECEQISECARIHAEVNCTLLIDIYQFDGQECRRSNFRSLIAVQVQPQF